MLSTDTDAVVARAARLITLDAASNPLVNPEFDANVLHDALLRSPEPTWVLEQDRNITAHLYGALLAQEGRTAVWTGPDGYSYDAEADFATLVDAAWHYWRERNALEHFVWCLEEPARLSTWQNLGFTPFSTRGALALGHGRTRTHLEGYLVRRGEHRDLAAVLDLDEQLDVAQGDQPERRSMSERETIHLELKEALRDPETNHYVVETSGHVIAQCMTFPAPSRRGSFPGTLFLSEVVVDAEHRRRGVARLLIDYALSRAREEGFEYCETQWRTTNEDASHYWTSYGFTPTYTRLRRAL